MLITASRGRNAFDSSPEPKTFDDFEQLTQFILSDLALEKGNQYITALCKVAPEDARHKELFPKAIGKPHRCKDCASDRSWLGLDIDGCLSAHSFNILQQVLSNYSALLYTTASHTPHAPRCRVIIELDRAVDRITFKRVTQRVQREIDEQMNGSPIKWDKACDTPEQALYLPLVTAQAWRFRGSPVEVLDVELGANQVSDAKNHSAPTTLVEDPLAVNEWCMQLERVKKAKKGQRNSTINSASFFLGQLIGAGRLQHGRVMESLVAAAEPWGEPEKQRGKILAGLSSGGQEPKYLDAVSQAVWGAGNAQIETLFTGRDSIPSHGPQLADFQPSALSQLTPLSALSSLGQLNELQSLNLGSLETKVLIKRGDTIVPEPICWIWKGWLACGKMHIIGGAPGCGKTTIACKLAATVTCGGLWPDGTRAPLGDVVIWSGEDDIENVLAPRMIASGADMKRVHFVVGIREHGKDVSFDPSKDLDKLAEALSSISDVRLLVVDPIVSTVGGVDSHRNAEVRRALQPLVDLTAKLDCGLIGITHFTKGTQGRDPVERITGSLAFAALARVVMVASVKEGSEGGPDRLLVRAKSNLGPSTGGFSYHLAYEPLPDYPKIVGSNLVWGDELTGSAREILGQAEGPAVSEDPGSLEACKAWLATYMKGGGVLAEDVQKAAAEARHSAATLKRAKAALGIKSKRFHDKWIWLPGPLPLLERTLQEAQGVQQAQADQEAQSTQALPPSLEEYWRKNSQILTAGPTQTSIEAASRASPKLT